MPNGLANIRGIEEEERKRQTPPPLPPVAPATPAESLPFKLGRGLRKVGAEVIAPAATSIYDVASLPTRAVKFGIGEAISGALGDRPPQRFERAPATTALSRMVQPSPVEMEQMTGQGIRGFAGATAPPPAPGRELLPEERPAAAGLTTPPPVFGPAAQPPSEAAVTRGLREEPAAPLVPGETAAVGREAPRDISWQGTPGEWLLRNPPQLITPASPRSFRHERDPAAAYNAYIKSVEAQNEAMLGVYSERLRAAGAPKDVAQTALLEAQTEELAKEGKSRRGLRAAQTVAAERAAETAKLVRTNIEVPTGETNVLGEPITTKRQVLYNPETEEFIDPTATRRAEGRPAVSLAEEHKALSDENRSIVEKHFADREDITSDEYLRFLKTLKR